MHPGDVHGTIRRMRDRVAHASTACRQSVSPKAVAAARALAFGRAGLTWIALLLGGCSAIVDPDLGRPPLACEIGQLNGCHCANGSDGVQRCNADGSYDDCRNAAGMICDAPRSAGSGGSNRDD